ncbi:Crp/Fnr family transcriptional regulator [Loktanella sp. IMCC34160]|uniref:Crp/Fnr family transcriptional regulator n=1 Tax=Loktanella sp. IMCC34160 TaxID=2510646 RepID=UPI0013EA5F02|nr:Crp/Fnr family transcriptional regulator [Loktanella sp. IMCC34160]
MNTDKLLSYDLPLFRGISAADLDPLDLGWSEQSFNAGQSIFGQEDDSHDVYFLLSGALLAVYWAEDGREIVFTRFPIGSMLGELSAFDNKPRSLAAYAKAPTRVLHLPQSAFLTLVDKIPEVRSRVINDLVARIRTLTEKTQELTTYSIEQRVCSYLIRLAIQCDCLKPGALIEGAPTHAEIAASIGANREMVSRTMTRLTKRGAVRSARQKIEIRDPDMLSEVL